MTDQRSGIDAAEFFLANRERDNGNVLSLQPLVGQLFVERNVRVAVNRRNNRGRFTDGGIS